MAKPLSTEEELALRKAYNIPEGEPVDAAAAITSPATLKELVRRNAPVAPTVSPIPKPTTPAPIKATTPMVQPPLRVVDKEGKPFTPPRQPVVVQPETGRTGIRTRAVTTGVPELERARLEKEKALAQSASGLETEPSVRISPDAERLLKERITKLETEGRTPAGERREITPTPKTVEETFTRYGFPTVGKVLGAIAPQTIVSKEQSDILKQRKDLAYKEAQRWFDDNPSFNRTEDNFTKVYESYYYGGIPEVMPQLTEDGKPPTLLGSRALAKGAEKAFTTTLPTGQVVESPIVTVGKALSAGEAVLTAGARKAGQEAGRFMLSDEDKKNAPPTESYTDLLVKDVAEGKGLMAGSEGFRETARLAGASKDMQDIAGAVGGTLGFIGGMAIPLDLGVGSAVSTGIRAGTGTAKVAKAFGATGKEAAIAGLKGAAAGAGEGLLDAYKIFTPKTGGMKAVTSEMTSATDRLLKSSDFDFATRTTLELAGRKGVQDAIIADRALGQASVDRTIPASSRPTYDPNILRNALESEYLALTGRPDFSNFVQLAEKYGIDFTNTAGSRAVASGTPPTNVAAKETGEALRKTSAGVDTTHYFDDIATGGRSDLYYNALLEDLSASAKSDLLAGKAIKRVDLEAAVDTFMNNVRLADTTADGSRTVAIAIALDKELAKRGIRLGARRILGDMKLPAGVTQASRGLGNLILPRTGEAFEAVNKSLKIDTARRFVNNFTASTGIVGRQVKLGNITLSAAEAKALMEDVTKKNPWVKKLGDRFRASKSGTIEITEQEFEELYKKLIDPYVVGLDKRGMAAVRAEIASGRHGLAGKNTVTDALMQSGGPLSLRPTEFYSPFQTVSVLNRAETQFVDALFNKQPMVAKLTSAQFNELVKGAIAIEAGSKVTAKTQTKLGEIGARLASETSGAELSYFTREVFKPKDFSEAGVGAFFVDNSRRFTEPTNKDPIVREIVGEVNARMGSLADTFKAKMRAEMGETQVGVRKTGVSRPQAFANVLVKEYTEGPVFRPVIETTKPQQITRSGGYEALRGEPRTAEEIAQATENGAYEMFRTNVAAMFGGYERTIDSIATTGRIVDLDNAAVSTAETRNLVTVLMETPAFKPYVDGFVRAVNSGDNVGAINLLQRLHIDFFGYSIEQILTRKGNVATKDIQAALEMATDAASKKPYGADIIDFYTQNSGLRSIDQTYRAASQQAMVIKPENFKEMVTGTYFTKAQANILDEVITTAQRKHPDLFPSASTLQDIATSDFQTVKNGLLYGLKDKATTLRAAGDTVTADFIDNKIIFWLESKGSATGGGLVGKEADDLLIAAIEDEVATMTSTTGKGNSYVKELTKDFKSSTGGTNADLTKAKSIIRSVIEDNEIQAGSAYKQLYGANARADATVLFYQTALTDIKNQLKAPLAGSLQGVAEKTATIPLLTKTAAGIKRPIQSAGNLKSITETMEGIKLATTANKLDQVVAKNGERVAQDLADLESNVSRFLTDEITAGEKELARTKETMIAGRPMYIMDDAGAAASYYRRLAIETILDGTTDIMGASSGIAKNGLLGGLFLPNLTYLMTNLLTGPTIIASQLGMRAGLETANPLLNYKVAQAMTDVYAPAWSKANKVLITTPEGMVYTSSDIAKIISEGGIGRSQASAELTNQLINGAIDWAGRTKLYADSNMAGKAIRRNFVNWNDMNVWSSLANSVDQWYRTGVLIKALERGEGLPNAMKLSREALFDYGNLSQFEKDVVSKVFWFWTFRRNSWRSVYVGLVTDPRKIKTAFAQRRGWSYVNDLGKEVFGTEKEDMDMNYPMKEYSDSRMYLSLTEDPENKRRYATYGPPIPEVQAVGDLVDYLSIPVAYAAGVSGVSGEPVSALGSASDLADLIIQQSNPYIQGIAAATVGMDLRTGKLVGDYLDPKLIWYVRQNPTIQQTFDTYVQTEAVPFDEEVAGRGYYLGRQWRIKKDDKVSQKNWAMLKSLLLTVGVSRTLSDYSALAQSISPLAGYEPEVQMDTSFWKAAGVITEQDAPTLEEIQRQNRLRAAGEIKNISTTEVPADIRYNKQ